MHDLGLEQRGIPLGHVVHLGEQFVDQRTGRALDGGRQLVHLTQPFALRAEDLVAPVRLLLELPVGTLEQVVRATHALQGQPTELVVLELGRGKGGELL